MTDELRFAKYQGTGNDFVMRVDLDDAGHSRRTRSGPSATAGSAIGADGVDPVSSARERPSRSWITATPTGASPRCAGNGVRCVGALVHDPGRRRCRGRGSDRSVGVRRLTAGTRRRGAGTGRACHRRRWAGPTSRRRRSRCAGRRGRPFLRAAVRPGWRRRRSRRARVSHGQPPPRPVRRGRPASGSTSPTSGPVLERHELFPEGTNVEFARSRDGRDRRARVGAGVRGDDGVRQRGVRRRGRGERGRAAPAASDGAVPRRRTGGGATRDRRGLLTGPARASSRRRWTSTRLRGGVGTRDRRWRERLVARAAGARGTSRRRAATRARSSSEIRGSRSPARYRRRRRRGRGALRASRSGGRARRSSCSPATWTPCRSAGTSRPPRGRRRSIGRGAADMKGGVAVMLEMAGSPATPDRDPDRLRPRRRVAVLRPRGAADHAERARAAVRPPA